LDIYKNAGNLFANAAHFMTSRQFLCAAALEVVQLHGLLRPPNPS
jgi:hypothetical protein